MTHATGSLRRRACPLRLRLLLLLLLLACPLPLVTASSAVARRPATATASAPGPVSRRAPGPRRGGRRPLRLSGSLPQPQPQPQPQPSLRSAAGPGDSEPKLTTTTGEDLPEPTRTRTPRAETEMGLRLTAPNCKVPPPRAPECTPVSGPSQTPAPTPCVIHCPNYQGGVERLRRSNRSSPLFNAPLADNVAAASGRARSAQYTDAPDNLPASARSAHYNDTLASLRDFYTRSFGEQWTFWSGDVAWFTPGYHLCAWEGVTCADPDPDPEAADPIVTGISLSGYALQGFVPAPFAPIPGVTRGLVNLTSLDLSQNCLVCLPSRDGLARLQLSHLPLLTSLELGSQWDVQVQLDPAVSSLPLLRELDLSETGFTTPLASVSRLPSLQSLKLDSSVVMGVLADLLPAKQLQVLSLRHAQMDSCEMPDFRGFNQLESLDLSGLPLTGRLPALEGLSSLRMLDVSNSPLSGPLPNISLPQLEVVFLIDTQLSGSSHAFDGCPSLHTLSFDSPLLTLDLRGMCTHWPNLASLWADGRPSTKTARVVGTLADLLNCTRMETLILKGIGLTGTVPDLPWPQLDRLYLNDNSLTSIGTLPHCTILRELSLSRNHITGAVPQFAALFSELQDLDLSFNQFSGPLPIFEEPPPMLQFLDLSNNEFSGPVPASYGEMPQLEELTLSFNQLTGPIPALEPAKSLSNLMLNDNNLTSRFAADGSLLAFPSVTWPWVSTFDASNNQLTGALDFIASGTEMPSLSNLLLINNALNCPVRLGPDDGRPLWLRRLRLNNNRFDNCQQFSAVGTSALDFFAQAPDLELFDGSDSAWGGSLPLLLPPKLYSFACARCHLNTLLPSSWREAPALMSLLLPGNTIQEHDSNVPPKLTTLDLSNCGLTSDTLIMGASEDFHGVPENLHNFDLSDNRLVGPLNPDIWSVSLKVSNRNIFLTTFRAARNELNGPLPEVSWGHNIQVYDLSSNQLSGPIPESVSKFRLLRELRLDNNSLEAPAEGPLLPSFILTAEGGGVVDPSSASGHGPGQSSGFSCPELTLKANPTAVVTLDAAYHRYELCSCTDRHFGRANRCQACLLNDVCSCSGELIVGCFPVEVSRSSGAVAATPLSKQQTQQTDYLFLPCPLTLSGESLCNPQGIRWPWSRHLNGSVTASAAIAMAEGADPLAASGWCFEGHEGRLCSACSPGYYASGRKCSRCLSPAVHWLIVLACVGMLVVLLLFLFHRAPIADAVEREAASIQAAAEPQARSSSSRAAHSSKDDSHCLSSSSASSPPVVPEARRQVLLLAIARVSALDSGSWKVLVFHCQSLGLLLFTQSSLPPVLLSFLAVTAGGSSGFSFSSLLAISCLGQQWDDLAHQLWIALVLPTAVLLAVAALTGLNRRYGTAAAEVEAAAAAPAGLPLSVSRGGYSREEAGSSRAAWPCVDASAEQHVFTAFVWRCYGVCWSLLTLLVFPSAQLAFTALACTDRREVELEAEAGGGESRPAYLNLLPYVPCDAAWRSRVLPPALLGALWWALIFPFGSAVLLRRLSRRLVDHGEFTVWPLLGQLVVPYRHAWWLWELALLLRRLFLVAVLAFVPSYSVWLPLLLFSVIQLSALAQHLCAPYLSAWSQRAELTSLYLLLANYFTALVLKAAGGGDGTQAAGSGNNRGLSIDAWAVMLLMANIAFILAMAVTLSLSAKRHVARVVQRLAFCLVQLAACLTEGDNSSDARFERARKAEAALEAEEEEEAAAYRNASAASDTVSAKPVELDTQYDEAVAPWARPSHSVGSSRLTPLLHQENPLLPLVAGRRQQ